MRECFAKNMYCTSACTLWVDGKCSIKTLAKNIGGVERAIEIQNDLLVEMCNHIARTINGNIDSAKGEDDE